MSTDKSGEAQRLAQLLMEWEIEQRNQRAVGCFSFDKAEAAEIAEHLVARGVSVGAESPSAPTEPICEAQLFLRALERFIDEDISGERLSEILGVNVADVMRVTSWVNNAKARGSVPSAPREASAHLLQLIADYGKANFECGNRFSDDPDVNAGANDRANEVWLAILDAVGAVDRGAPSPSAPTKHHDYRAPVCWCGERNSGGSTPEHEGNP